MPVADSTTKWVDEQFAESIVPTLVEYIKIPNKSAMFDPDWKKNGHVDRAVALLAGWAKQNLPEGAKRQPTEHRYYCPIDGPHAETAQSAGVQGTP